MLAVLDLLTTWRFVSCFFACGSAAIWLLYNLDRPLSVVSFIAMLVVGVVLGAFWQRRHEKKVHAK
ncbi:MAG TPA: hypothetical protein VFV69_17485 [Steroidobacteraceae bacterium]|nr:hypothetical protein [Steroidobacteraceae bacterium]